MDYNELFQKFTEFKESCNKFDFSIYFNISLKNVIKWLINNRSIDADISYLFNSFYHVFMYEFNSMLLHKKYTYIDNLNKLSNKDRLDLINKCIYYFCDFYKDYINKLFYKDMIKNRQFIFLLENDKEKYLNSKTLLEKANCITRILLRIRVKIIQYYYFKISNRSHSSFDKYDIETIPIHFIFDKVCERLFNSKFVKKYYKSQIRLDDFRNYFEYKSNITSLITFEDDDYITNIPIYDLYYLIKECV